MILFISVIIFILVSVLTFFLNNFFLRIFYTIVAIWLGFAFYLFLASYIDLLVPAKDFGILCFWIGIVVSIYGVVHARIILVKNISVKLPNLPIEWLSKKAVFVSDIHLGAVYGQSFMKKIVNKINEINPDIIFIGGDLYDGVKVNEATIIQPLSLLHPALGIYFITGNHEEFRDDKHFLNPIKDLGIRVLNNEMVMIDGLQLIGVDDHDSTNVKNFGKILSDLKIDKNKPSILLKHQPFQLKEASEAGISFQISGHTHRAQIFPLNIFTILIYKGYDYGFKMRDKMAVYTSSGVGTWGPPLRVGSDSEIVVFRFSLK